MSQKQPAKLSVEEIGRRLLALGQGWAVQAQQLEKSYPFPNFREALAFTNQIGQIAESMNHHPDIFLAWGLVRLSITTHSAGGLTENDFALAAKIDETSLH